MRLIDADALIADLGKGLWGKDYDKALAEAIIREAPSIDICFCRECKWFDSGKNDSEIWSMRTRHFGKYIDVNADDFCSYGCRDSEKPNNCEHITEDGVTCAKYPACDDCLDNPLNKVKGVGKTDRFRKE